MSAEIKPNMIGAYGPWAESIVGEDPGRLSFRRGEWQDLEAWRSVARQRLLDLLAQPDAARIPDVTVQSQFVSQGLHVEELSWELPYGPPTRAIFLKPEGATARLPGILALHDHAGNKYFGRRKITRTSEEQHPMMVEHQDHYYGGVAWANEVARRGYAVLVHDAFPFASRRVLLDDVPDAIRGDLDDGDPEAVSSILAYNQWAAGHESIMAKSLFCAGTTWPGVFLTEDQRALDVLCARDDVDPERVGCGGLSGGGMRTVFLGGVDPRIRCAVCVGLMTTWRDCLLNKCHTHTWMLYVPLLPRDLDFPEILGLRVPKATMVLNNREDRLFTLSEMRRADSILADVYAKADAADRYRCAFFPGPHKFDLQMQAEAFDWFDRWLGG
jgi:dienelactone hydrolase